MVVEVVGEDTEFHRVVVGTVVVVVGMVVAVGT